MVIPLLRRRRRPVVCLTLAVACLPLACVKGEIREEDIPALVTVADFEAFGYPRDSAPGKEVLRRNRYFDGSLEIEYEYQSPETAEEPLFIYAVAGFERSARNAGATYRAVVAGEKLGARMGGVEVESDPDFYSWGDESYFAYMVGDYGRGGNVFVAREGSKTYSLILAGRYLDDPEEWAALLGPKLEYLRSYTPK